MADKTGETHVRLLPLREMNGHAEPEVKNIPQVSKRDLGWIEGLRGVAAVVVVFYHTTMAWRDVWLHPAPGLDIPPRFMQLPFIRVITSGRVAIPIFAFITGFVCAHKPHRLMWRDDYLACLDSVYTSSFRRFPRIILPATIALIGNWVLTQLHAFTAARHSGGWAQAMATPPLVEGGFLGNVLNLFKMLIWNWCTGLHMVYDDYQWAILGLLKASLMVYLTLIVTLHMKFQYRVATYCIMITYWHFNPIVYTETFGLQTYLGMLASDITLHPSFEAFMASKPMLRNVLPAILMPIGLYCISFPYFGFENAAWSRQLFQVGKIIFPDKTDIVNRFTALGTDLCIVSIFVSPYLKLALSGRVLVWLGKISFAIYLLHGALLRTLLAWLLVGMSGEPWDTTLKNKEGKPIDPPKLWPRSLWQFAYALPIFWAVLLVSATAWELYVEPWCAKITAKIEQRVNKPL